ncbi:membrane protease subunit [Nitzschia inconspicua]|uniref:Prohibitin n=1 Tax=Nitzschia inconspicua TaxID=303405 RepID=A0A9K3Q200_9STRA|nr:membrane protease subunit [Nitzschia inconspicua]
MKQLCKLQLIIRIAINRKHRTPSPASAASSSFLIIITYSSTTTIAKSLPALPRCCSSKFHLPGVGAAGVFTVSQCIYNVDGGERAVMFDQLRGGVLDKVVGEGTHFLIPVVQRPTIFDVRTKPREVPSVTGTKDLQMVNIKLRVLWRPIVEELPRIYRELGTDFDERVLPSIGNEVLKSIVAQYNAEELLSKRAEVSQRIKTEMMKRARTFHLEFDDVAITHLTFGREFMNAIEAKQVASQEAERQQWVVVRAEQERQAVVTRAEGEAEAASIITKAMEKTGNAIIEVRRIDAAKEIAGKLANSRNVVYLPNTGGGDGGSGANLLLGLDPK